MARATSTFQTQDYGQPGSGEWQELRGELVALLDQVETQVARAARPEPTYQGLAERMRDLRHQVTEAEPDTRHREALRSVQRAIDKFTDRDEPMAHTNPRDTLESAIQQIRSRHFGAAAPASQMPQPQPVLQSAPHFDELAEAVGGISTRLERLEGELRVQAKGQTTNVREIADQVGQLSHVVELLAGAVGETGQVKRLEGHIAGLAKLIADGPKVDMAALNQRLDDVSLTVGKLAELQKHYADRSDVSGMTARLDDVSATVGRLADLQVQYANRVESPKDGLKEAMGAIEDGVRNIYDRVDAIERTMAMPPAELEKITEELGRLAQAMKSPQQPQGLIELIDALNVRISDMEGRTQEVGELKLDMEALRNTVLGALEPRFAALEQQLEVLSDKVDDRSSEVSIGQLEAQVRQLVARMDQTGEQLTGLAKLYAPPAVAEAPDFDQLADLVASRTSDAMRQLDQPTKAGLDEAGYAEIERRVSQAMKAAAKENPAPETVALDATIREVNERLKRLESSLEAKAETPVAAPASFAKLPEAPAPRLAEPKPPAAAPAPVTSEPLNPISPLLDNLSFEDELPSRPQPVDLGDSMPSDPSVDAPLLDKPFGEDPNPLRTALEVKNGPRKRPADPAAELPPAPMPSLDLRDEPETPAFDPSLAERPPQPKSSLDLPADEVFVASPKAELRPVADEPPMPNRNTFIEAHRRAARQAAAGKAEPISAAGGSLIGKAFARFQATRSEAPDVAATPDLAVPAKPAAEKRKPVKAEKLARTKDVKPAKDETSKSGLPFSGLFKAKPSRQLAGDKEPASQWQPDEPTTRVLPLAPEPSMVALGAEETSPPADDAQPKQSFLLRHKQPILLAASIVALACLTINLINQRMKPTETPAPAATAAQDVGDAALTPVPLAEQGFVTEPGKAAPRVIPTLDKLTTASIGGATPQKFVASAETPKMPQAFEAATEIAARAPGAAETAPAGEAKAPAGEAKAPAGVANLSDKVEPLLDAMESPVKVDRPPAAVGPEPLLAAAANGDARAQFEVAAIYTEGRAVPEDLKAAAMWYERAAGQGFAPAQYRLGNLYENGRGVEKDLVQARLWYQQAAEAGNRMAMHNLAALYAGGGLGTQQFDAAAKWFEEAASRGMKDSQFNLGMLYARGLGVKQDLAASFKWFSLAAAKGDKDAAKSRDDIAASLDATTAQRVTAEVAAFQPQPIDFVANFAPIGTWSAKFDPGAPITNVKVVKGVQMALRQLGFDIGTPDGMTGPKTAEAIKSFERSTGMSESGEINPRLLAVLGSQPV
ncbi:MAG TPA: peptidoglycan-binding protein [Devosia sp.]|jgi:localization factor PodJL|uniref:peptidoglycan-binding protein n=1 Tax=Devosia sp. TaxID=1871048 RepID=UPI002DDCFAFB|nr:peptidoglycan-binding protein [Devosia sp.]HEV2517084.1 peptidoglycan-binding protein [Devosia sp.]